MTQATMTPTFYVYRIEYEDPAGGFGGWFLHTTWSSVHNVAYGSPTVITFPGDTRNLDYEVVGGTGVGGLDDSSRTRAAFYRSVEARLEKLHGVNAVRWTATPVEAVTPAVIDDDF